MKTRKKGFTLIELLTVVAIVAIVVALALPSFRDALRKSRRSDAIDTIMDIHMAQERYRANNTTYGTITQLGFTDPQISPKGHFSVAVSANTATGYTITATARNDQVNDYCGNFVLTNAAGVLTKTNTATNADLCWRK